MKTILYRKARKIDSKPAAERHALICAPHAGTRKERTNNPAVTALSSLAALQHEMTPELVDQLIRCTLCM